MDLTMVAAFWVVSLALAMTPGADWAYTISAGLRDRAIAPALTGMMLGYTVITLVVAAGVGAVVVRHPAILGAMTVLGAGYLVWLGVGVLRHPPQVQAAGDAGSPRQWLLRGIFISGLNPKALLLFLALLPQFTNLAAGWPVGAQIAGLGALHMLNCTLVYLAVGISARAVLRSRPIAARRVSQASGIAMIVIAGVVLADLVM
ncbi:LysE family translocator [Paracoccus sp. (in: a-proteobacteria)]|uniref:LysE family translocator n=1 Tax=Paracoccus sp. TaxID=267 RepID=UPI0026DEEE52|nr:LysE family translocator [Paracoccus sp. (in: a-proteobacteria)]MDO5648627.1 LysE family translocator [Paracoccus sp. (in: a-proteobacteria)]